MTFFLRFGFLFSIRITISIIISVFLLLSYFFQLRFENPQFRFLYKQSEFIKICFNLLIVF
ncbi:hypothetical protein X975_03093, partial [Stegodyphus mimosarum]